MLRVAQKLSQADLAKKLGITRSSVNAWELGFSSPSTGYLVELANLFHVSTDYLLGLKQNESLDISGLDTEQMKILYGLTEHFRKENHK
ncbi:MAG: helix-turn-helix transcriptional regulator [Anaerobutyricum hallii]|uniref:helix-turn-helix domain-containing protein n=1 Tax=Anaerobutyricum hallii TaxID=39488 RepID=UPI00242DCC54|nr:helix-turn-helix transcriptional regulator [Anaerobutyricum hallii]MDD6589927.1 helix-turn-helix transcriptional regulator [Anaerobutyricum hallii]